MTVVDLHDWYRRLFGNPETLGLTPGGRGSTWGGGAGAGVAQAPDALCSLALLAHAHPGACPPATTRPLLLLNTCLHAPPAASFAALTAPAVQLEGDNYEGQGLATNANASSWFYAGNDASWRSFPSIKVAEGATANDSPGGWGGEGAGGRSRARRGAALWGCWWPAGPCRSLPGHKLATAAAARARHSHSCRWA